MAGLQEKTTSKSMSFLFGDGKARDILQKKAIRGVTNKVVEETAGSTQPNLTLETSTSAFIKPSLYDKGLSSLCDRDLFFLYAGDNKRFRRNSRQFSG